jgi:hypothetical protein
MLSAVCRAAQHKIRRDRNVKTQQSSFGPCLLAFETLIHGKMDLEVGTELWTTLFASSADALSVQPPLPRTHSGRQVADMPNRTVRAVYWKTKAASQLLFSATNVRCRINEPCGNCKYQSSLLNRT